MELWIDEAEQEDQSRSAQQKTSLESTGGMPDSSSSGTEGSRILLRVNSRDDSKPDVSPSCGPFPHKLIVTVSFSHSNFDFLKNWFAA